MYTSNNANSVQFLHIEDCVAVSDDENGSVVSVVVKDPDVLERVFSAPDGMS
jgi:hypothetical protein